MRLLLVLIGLFVALPAPLLAHEVRFTDSTGKAVVLDHLPRLVSTGSRHHPMARGWPSPVSDDLRKARPTSRCSPTGGRRTCPKGAGQDDRPAQRVHGWTLCAQGEEADRPKHRRRRLDAASSLTRYIPRRVVSLVPGITEVIMAIGAGDALKGVTYHTPAGWVPRGVAIVGGFYMPDLERIKAIGPDLLFVSARHRRLLSSVQWEGTPPVMVELEPRSVEDGLEVILTIGRIFHREQEARRLVQEIRSDFRLVAEKVERLPAGGRRRVVRVMGRDRIMVPGPDSFQWELIEAAGGIPMRPRGDGAVVAPTVEEWRAFDPQVIYGCSSDKGLLSLLRSPGWSEVEAVKKGAIYFFPCALTCRASAHMGYFVKWLAATIYGEEFAAPPARIQPDAALSSRRIPLDLGYIASAEVVTSRIEDFENKTLVIRFKEAMEVVSTLEGERQGIIAVGNHYIPPPLWGLSHQRGIRWLKERVTSLLGLERSTSSFLFTGADMDNLAVVEKRFRKMRVYALVTAGVMSNAQRASRDRGRYYGLDPGTINIIILTNCRLSRRAMTRAVITATEAKSAAISDLDIRSSYLPLRFQATGTGTDNVLVVSGAGQAVDSSGGHTKMGELIASAVYQAVTEAIARQNGIISGRSIFHRLRERRIGLFSLARKCAPEQGFDRFWTRLQSLLLDPKEDARLKLSLAASDRIFAEPLPEVSLGENELGCNALSPLPQPLARELDRLFRIAAKEKLGAHGPGSGQETERDTVALLVIDPDVPVALDAVEAANGKLANVGVRIQLLSSSDIKRDPARAARVLRDAKVIVVDVMGSELEEFVVKTVDPHDKLVYALRGSTDDARLQAAGFRFDKQVSRYFDALSTVNIENMLLLVAARHLHSDVQWSPPEPVVKEGIFHPAAPRIFHTLDEYLQWLKGQPGYRPDRPVIGLTFYSSFLLKGHRQGLARLIEEMEAHGFTVLACFGKDKELLERYLIPAKSKLGMEAVVAFTLKFSSAIDRELGEMLSRLDVPIFNAVSLYRQDTAEWLRNPAGLSPMETAWTMAAPEVSGLVEPTVLMGKREVKAGGGRTYFVSEPIEGNVRRLMERIDGLIRLRHTPNREKRVAIMFYNHHPGKQNVGASYLNVFQSIKAILDALAKAGYTTGEVPGAHEIKEMILSQARNIGAWAPGELDRLLASGHVIRVPIARYKAWFSHLPSAFREKVVEQWGRPEDSAIMRAGGDFVIPAVRCGNILLLPEPARGWGSDPMKLYHSPTLYPHHQYLAVYLWLAREFKAHAIIHLGTHATYEWTPGKQVGLSPSCSPEVLTSGIPNIYPYSVDDVGEAIQAKRRGRGVMVSHLTPMITRSGLYREYIRLGDLINRAVALRAKGGAGVQELMGQIDGLVKQLGLGQDIGLGEGALGLDDLESIQSYLEEVKEAMIPWGLHTFGKAPPMDAVMSTASIIADENGFPREKVGEIAARIRESAKMEMASLLKGLAGRYVEPGEGNDPVRNPASLPTGRNLYGFNPARIPSRTAWKLGRKAADSIIEGYLSKHGKYPDKVAVVLWATETQRNEGVNECTILWLIGIRPRWSPSGRVTGMEVIPGRELGRPRIDVIVNASGLYRDLFPDKMAFIDRAIRLASLQKDVDNLIARNSQRLYSVLVSKGMALERARRLSQLRIFSEQPGSYGTGVAEMTGKSGIWKKEQEIVDVFEMRTGFAYGGGEWGVPAKELLRAQLKEVKAVVHSRSSNLYSTMDNDDVFQYLGGLSMAVRKESGAAPETLMTVQTMPGKVEVEDVARTIGRELRSRYLNPRWIEAMQKEGYAGAREMSNFVEYLWGWQVTTPGRVGEAQWKQVYEVYVEDKYGLHMREFFRKASPWAFQSITGRMLEAVRKGYWHPSREVVQRLAASYAVSVAQEGVACCDHTCNNPLLNQMVVSIISVPGLVSPEVAERFRLAMEKSGKMALKQMVQERRRLQKRLNAPGDGEPSQPSASSEDSREVEGYVMEEEKRDESGSASSSGLEWKAVAVLLLALAIFFGGAAARRER